MQAEVVSVGSELLLGQVVDTNAATIARHLAAIGLDLYYKTTVGDNPRRAAGVLRTALDRSDVVITTGGLGPTADDITREAVAQATGRGLVFVPELLRQIESFFHARGFTLSPSNRRQAFVPEGAIPVENPVGTAPAFIVEEGAKALIALPGVPREMEHLLRNRVIPYLRERFALQSVIVSRILRVCGLGESRIGEILGDLMERGANPTVGTMAHLGQVDVRIAAKAKDEAEAETLIAPVEADIRGRLADLIFGVDGETLEGVVAERLEAQDLHLALLEVGTGGLLAERLTRVPAALSRVQGLVLGTAEAVGRLGFLEHGSVRELVRAVRQWGKADLGATVTLGPPEDSVESPIHQATLAVASAHGTEVREFRFGGDLGQVRVRAAIMTLDLLRRALIR